MGINENTISGPSFSFRNRVFRTVWMCAYLLLFRYSPKPMHKWRALILRLFGAKIGKDTHVYPKVIIWAPWNLELDDECGIANGVNLYNQGMITIGKRAIISQDAYLCTGTHDFTRRGFPLVTRPISVGDNAWVAAQVFIHPGVTVGEGTVLGARSVVTKDMPAWTICAGFPCKPLRERVIID